MLSDDEDKDNDEERRGMVAEIEDLNNITRTTNNITTQSINT